MDQHKQNMSSDHSRNMSAQSTPVMQKMQFKMHHQRLKESDGDSTSMMLSPMMDRRINKISTKAMSAMDLTNGQQPEMVQQNAQLSLMLHQQQKFPQHNHPMEQQMYQQFNQKPVLNQMMKVGPNHNASLADFRSIIHNQSVDDLIASREQMHAIVNAQKHSDYIVSDYMDKIQTRIALLETELKFADRKLHLLYSEYNEMLTKIEKLENLTIAQQTVLANLMDLCNNQSHEVHAAKAVQAKAAALFGINPQDIVMSRGEPFNDQFQQEAMVDSTQTEFNEMLEDLKNEAIIDGLRGLNRNLQKNASNLAANHPFAAMSENFQEFEGDADYEALMEMLTKQPMNPNAQFFRNLIATDMKEGQRETNNQHLLQQQNAMELLKNLNEAQLNMEVDFFRSGELNKNLFSSLPPESSVGHSSLDMIYEDNEEKADAKETSPGTEKSEANAVKIEDSVGASLTTGSVSSHKKSKVKKKKHHQQLQQQHLQLQQSDDQLIHEIIEDILKIENMTNLLSKNQLDELKALVKSDLRHFQNLKKLDNNFLTLLVNPASSSSPNHNAISIEEEDQKFSELIRKIKKNLDILKKLDPGDVKESKSPCVGGSLYNDDEYFQSLKKSLDRHNSMQLLLHMQHPNLQSKSPSVLMSGDFLSDDQLDGDESSSSPPPPAPNGDVGFYYKSEAEEFIGIEQEWNPFHVDIMLMKEQKKKEIEPMSSNSLSPYRISGQRSPKNAKSDSGLSSMSGFSSFEKSPNSPSNSPYDQLHSRTGLRPTMSSQDYLKMLSNYQQMKIQAEAGTSQFAFSDVPSSAPAPSDALYSEENLNYIKELSQNVPICSIYENKSIFDNMTAIKTPSAWEHYVKNQQQIPPTVESMKSYPDLIVNQDEAKVHPSQPRLDALMEQKKILNQQKLQLKQEQLQQKLRKTQSKQRSLTDHLVYYPSPISITDYNSSMNLEYQREFAPQDGQQKFYHQRDAQNVQHDEFMQNAHAQQQLHLQHMQQKQQQLLLQQQHDPNGSKKAGGSEKASYLNKVHAWLPDIKLKKISKRHRSQSLPGEVEDEEHYANQSYKMNLKKSSLDEQSSHSRGGKKKDIYVMKSYMKGKKKQLVHTMSSIMNKAKVYRRHSFSHHMSDDEENQSHQSPSHHRATRSASSAAPSKRSYSDTETDISSMFSDGDECDTANDMSEAERNQQEPLAMFATMADSLPKHSDTGDSDKNSDRPVSDSSSSSRKKLKENQVEPSTSEQNSFNLNFSSTSMEFAVSRKVGIFRKKSSVSDEPTNASVPTSVSPTATNNNFVFEKSPVLVEPPKEPPTSLTQSKKSQPAHTLMKTHSIYVDSIDDDNGAKANNGEPSLQSRPPVPSPRFEHSRSNSMKGASLDVPGYREDEDNKSQHSFRTISSSRRQSTEDSIDTDDEYFYYEMRNLEELERNSHMESILQDNKNELINNIIQLDTSLNQCEHEPDDSVKKQMGFVLHELKSKVKLRDSQDNSRQDAVNNNKVKNIYDKFTMATNIQDMPWNRDSDDDYDDHMDQLNQIEMEMRDSSYGKVKKKRKKGKTQKYSPSSSSADDEDDKSIPSTSPPHDEFHLNVDKFDRHSQSSGVTSGPDSPIQSDEEAPDSPEKDKEDYDKFKQRQKNERLLEHSQQPPSHQDDDRGANENQVQSGEGAATETGLKDVGNEKPPLRKLMQLSSTISTDSTNQDSGISDTSGAPGIMSSKWKLLKTLKERKEMNNQVKIKEEEEGVKEKTVSSQTALLSAEPQQISFHFCKEKFSLMKSTILSMTSSPSNRCV